ncbi:MAG: Zn-ribbon domain-containing OB-fold protein, partial [Acidimicrobiales bacterium]
MAGVPVHDGLFATGAEPHLIGAACRACRRQHFPSTSTCPYCGSREVGPGALPTTGRLWAWTTVTAAPPGWAGPVPFGFGVVELGEFLRVVTRITEADATALRTGQEMRLVLDEVGERDGQAVVSWAFA